MTARGTDHKTFKGTKHTAQAEGRSTMTSQAIPKAKSDKVSWGDSVSWWYEDTYTNQ